MKLKTITQIAGLAVLPMLVCQGAAATQIVVNPAIGNASTIFFDMALGQTFTAEDPALSSISFYINDMNAAFAPNDHSLMVNLYSGNDGAAGALIGSATTNNIADGTSGFVNFDFSGIGLSVGSSYSAMLVDSTVRWGIVIGATNYSGGSLISSGVRDDTYGTDYSFKVTPQAVPEPTTISMLLGGLGLMGLASRRKNRGINRQS